MDEEHNWINAKFTSINDTLSLFKMQISDLQKVIKDFEKDVKKDLKKTKTKQKPKSLNKKSPSGFAKPTQVTKELCEFMNKPEGTEIARTEVTKALVNYIQQNGLIETNNSVKNKIVPDDKLKNLLGIQDEEIDGLTYFNIQKYMNKHFYKKGLHNSNNSNNIDMQI